jgi:hypothetical protein
MKLCECIRVIRCARHSADVSCVMNDFAFVYIYAHVRLCTQPAAAPHVRTEVFAMCIYTFA